MTARPAPEVTGLMATPHQRRRTRHIAIRDTKSRSPRPARRHGCDDHSRDHRAKRGHDRKRPCCPARAECPQEEHHQRSDAQLGCSARVLPAAPEDVSPQPDAQGPAGSFSAVATMGPSSRLPSGSALIVAAGRAERPRHRNLSALPSRVGPEVLCGGDQRTWWCHTRNWRVGSFITR